MSDGLRKLTRCDGVTRRTSLRVGALSLFGLSCPRLLAAEAAADGSPKKDDLACILLWTDGGLANMDTLDMKPHAPAEYRGEFRPITSSLAGEPVCEHLPRMSQMMHEVCQIRSIEHTGSQHAEASHFMQTGYPQVPDVNAAPVGSTVYPALGCVVGRELGWRNELPPFVAVANSKMPYSHAGYMGSEWNPLWVAGDPNSPEFTVEDVSLPTGFDGDRVSYRRRLLSRIDAWQRQLENKSGGVADRGKFYQQAYQLITSPAAKKAFALHDEAPAVRDAYGRNRGGQATLLARRLVEAGVRFVTVQFSGYDTHDRNFIRLKGELLPVLDQAWSALLTDLKQRGMLEKTLVICAGEFGRTPMVNGAAGRDHWPFTNVVGLSGGGVKTGQVIGRTDARCERVVGHANSTLDYAATIFRLLGVDDTREYRSNDGRPIAINNGGRAIAEVFA